MEMRLAGETLYGLPHVRHPRSAECSATGAGLEDRYLLLWSNVQPHGSVRLWRSAAGVWGNAGCRPGSGDRGALVRFDDGEVDVDLEMDRLAVS